MTIEFVFNFTHIIVEYKLNYYLNIKEENNLSKNEFICDCNIIHQDVVKQTLEQMTKDVGVSIIVIINALRMLSVKKLK